MTPPQQQLTAQAQFLSRRADQRHLAPLQQLRFCGLIRLRVRRAALCRNKSSFCCCTTCRVLPYAGSWQPSPHES
jgi:hypothetical protein